MKHPHGGAIDTSQGGANPNQSKEPQTRYYYLPYPTLPYPTLPCPGEKGEKGNERGNQLLNGNEIENCGM